MVYNFAAISRLRMKRRLTVAELAKRAGLTVRGLGYITAGSATPNARTIARLATALGVAPSAFFLRARGRHQHRRSA